MNYYFIDSIATCSFHNLDPESMELRSDPSVANTIIGKIIVSFHLFKSKTYVSYFIIQIIEGR